MSKKNHTKITSRERHPLRNKDIFVLVHKKLRLGWSPEMIADKLKSENGESVISHETIYRYVYGSKNAELRL